MNEIIQRLIDKTGLPEDKTRMALDVVVSFLKEKLPAPVAAQLDGLMEAVRACPKRSGKWLRASEPLEDCLARRKRDS